MKTLLSFLLLPSLLLCQTAVYPGSVVTDQQLFVAANNLGTSLLAAQAIGDTVAVVTSSAGIVPNMLMTICPIASNGGCTTPGEIEAVCAVSGNTLTIGYAGVCPSITGRGFDSTVAAAHAAGSPVNVNYVAWDRNSDKAEIKAIEGTLGANLANVFALIPAPPATFPQSFMYTYLCAVANTCAVGGASGAGLVASTPATFTLTPCPKGIVTSGTYQTPFYISGGTSGFAEKVALTAGTCTSGASSGTVTFTPANTHTGAFTLTSATSGVQEALNSLGAAGVLFLNSSTPSTLHAQVTTPLGAFSINGQGNAFLNTHIVRAADYPNGDLFVQPAGSVMQFKDLVIQNYTVAPQTSGAAIHNAANDAVDINDVYINGGYIGFQQDSGQFDWVNSNFIGSTSTAYGVLLNGGTDSQFVGGRIAAGAAGLAAVAIRGFDTLSFDGITFDSGIYELDMRAVTNYVANIIVGPTCKFDTATTSAVLIGQPDPTKAIGGITIKASMMNGELAATTIHGIDICVTVPCTSAATIQIIGASILEWGGDGIAIGAGVSNIIIAGSLIAANNSRNLATNFGGIFVEGTGVQMVSNKIFGGTFQYCGISLYTGATNIMIESNDLAGNITAPICLVPAPVSLVLGSNRGVSDVQGNVADAATLALPLNPTFFLNGSGTAVTSITGIWPGRTFTMLPTGASISFTGGATIGATFATTQNVPVTGFVDSSGTVWLK